MDARAEVRLLIGVERDHLVLRSAKDGREARAVPCFDFDPDTFLLAPDESRVIATSGSKTRVFSLPDGALLEDRDATADDRPPIEHPELLAFTADLPREHAPTRAAFSPDGTIALVAGDVLRLARADGERVEIELLSPSGDAITSALVSQPNGAFDAAPDVLRYLAVVSGDERQTMGGATFEAMHRPGLFADFLAGKPMPRSN